MATGFGQGAAGHCVAGALACFAASSCSHEECECEIPGFNVFATGVIVVSIEMSGPGCDGATILSYRDDPRLYRYPGFVAGADHYVIEPKASGTCTITVTLDDQSRREQRIETSYQGGSCCAGWYSVPADWSP